MTIITHSEIAHKSGDSSPEGAALVNVGASVAGAFYPGLPLDDFMRGKSVDDHLAEYGAQLERVDPSVYSDAIRCATAKQKYIDWGAAESLANELEKSDPKAAQKLRMCHDVDKGKVEFCPTDPHHHSRYIPLSCDLRICPICAERHANRLMRRYEIRLALAMSQNVVGWRLRGLTLTMRRPEGGDDRALEAELVKASKKLMRHFGMRKDKRLGCVIAVEWGPKGGNLHAHITFYGPYLPYADIRTYWEKLTGNHQIWIRSYTSVSAALREGVKYAVKPLGIGKNGEIKLTVKDLVSIHHALQGRRRIHVLGSFYRGPLLKTLAAAQGVDLDSDKPEPVVQCEVCNDWLQSEPVGIMRSFVDRAKSSKSLILKEGIKSNISEIIRGKCHTLL